MGFETKMVGAPGFEPGTPDALARSGHPKSRPRGESGRYQSIWMWIMGFESKMVGAPGFEPGTFCTPSKRATSLRYAPTWAIGVRVYHGGGCGVNGLLGLGEDGEGRGTLAGKQERSGKQEKR